MIKLLMALLFVFPRLSAANSLHDLDFDTVEFSTVKQIIDKNPESVNERDADKHTPLMKAVAADRKQIIDYLLEHGAYIDDLDERGNAVILATEKLIPNTNPAEYITLPTDFLDKIKYLVEKHANVNTQNNLGETMMTIGNKSAETYQYLINAGADFNKGGKKGISPLMYTIYLNNFDAFMVILNRSDKSNPTPIVNYKDDVKDSPIHYVARYCSAPKFGKELLDRKALPNSKSSKGMTFLSELLAANCPASLFNDYIKMLDEHGYKLSKIKAIREQKRFIDEAMTLHDAILLGNIPYIKILLENEVNLMPTYPNGKTPLMIAIERNDLELFETLFPYDKDNKSKDKLGRTAFKCAEELNRVEMVNKFIMNGIEE